MPNKYGKSRYKDLSSSGGQDSIHTLSTGQMAIFASLNIYDIKRPNTLEITRLYLGIWPNKHGMLHGIKRRLKQPEEPHIPLTSPIVRSPAPNEPHPRHVP
jgi:hypothetical protein